MVHGVLRDAAGRLRDGLTGLAVRVDGAVTAAVPGLAADADLRRALARSTQANVADVLALLGDPELPLDTGVPPEAIGFATAVVRRGIDPGDLAHAYMVGQNELWRAWMEAVAQELTGPGLVTALEVSSSRLFGRVDFLVAQLMRHVDRERERWMGGALARRTQLVRTLLTGEDPGVAEASRALGYDLDRWVLAAVLWDAGTSDDPAGPHDRLEAQAAVAARAAGAPRALTLAPGRREPVDVGRHAGSAGPRRRSRPRWRRCCPSARASPSARRATGLEGFRLGHREALDARRVAELGERGGVVRYDEVEAISLLSGRPRPARALRPAHARPAHRRRRDDGAAARDAAGVARRRAATRAAPPSGCTRTRTRCSTGCSARSRSSAGRSTTTAGTSSSRSPRWRSSGPRAAGEDR